MAKRTLHSLRVLTIPLTLGLISANLASADDYTAQPLANPVVVDEPVTEIKPVPATEPAKSEQSNEAGAEAKAEAAPALAAAPAAQPCRCCNSVCCTKKKKAAATAAMKGAYKGVFYDNDFSYLEDPCYDGDWMLGDAFKRLCCGKLDTGGEVRVRYHNEEGFRGAGLSGNDDDFWLSRVRLFTNYRMNQHFRFYGEYLYADSGGEALPPLTIEENRGDIQNLFVDTTLGNTTLRLGRQEILFGAQRLLSPLDWANTRRRLDGGRLLYKGSDWDVDGFYFNPVARVAATADRIDSSVDDIHLFGAYTSRKKLAIGKLEPYYLGLVHEPLNFDYHTLGTRVAGSNDNFLYEVEGGYQFGSNSNGSSHSAGFMTGGIGKKFNFCTCYGAWNPIFWFWYDWASGGNGDFVARGDNGFDHVFPLAHKYLGFMDLFGRRNINDVNFQIITPIGKRVQFLVWYHHFFLDKATTPYNLNMTPFNTTALAGDKELGSEIDLAFNLTLTPRDNVLIGYSHFAAGKYYDTTPGVPTNADAQFFYAQFQKRF